jgi:cell division septation protein DedD
MLGKKNQTQNQLQRMRKKAVDLGAAAKMSIVLPKEEGVSSTDQDNFADFSIQYASFRTKDKAKEVFFSLKKMGFSPSIVRSVTDKKVWFTVKAGNFKTRDEAKQALSIVNTPELRKQNMTGIIVANNQTDRVVNP